MLERSCSIGGLETTVVGDPASAEFVCVVLHGFAMSPADLTPFGHALGLPGLFIFPRAPLQARVEPERTLGHAWWDIDPVARARALAIGPRDFAGQNPVDLGNARRTLFEFLRALEGDGPGGAPVGEVIPPEIMRRLPRFLTGFSQGGMLLADCFMRDARALGAAGLGFFSASRIAIDDWPAVPPGESAVGLPVFLSHGYADPDLAFSAGEALRQIFVAAGADLTFVPFAGGHEIPLVAWRGFRRFLTANIPIPIPNWAAEPRANPAANATNASANAAESVNREG